jgi:hypothetical protein
MLDVPDPGAGIVLGLKLTVVLVGTPEADNPTALLNPPPIVVVIVDVPCVPCIKLNKAGLAAMVKLGCDAVTVKLTVVVLLRLIVLDGVAPAAVAATVSVYVPGAVLTPTAIVIVELPAPGAGIITGLKLTVVPLGMPLADSCTGLLKPPPIAVVIVELPCSPCASVKKAGDADTLSVGRVAFTVRFTVTVC